MVRISRAHRRFPMLLLYFGSVGLQLSSLKGLMLSSVWLPSCSQFSPLCSEFLLPRELTSAGSMRFLLQFFSFFSPHKCKKQKLLAFKGSSPLVGKCWTTAACELSTLLLPTCTLQVYADRNLLKHQMLPMQCHSRALTEFLFCFKQINQTVAEHLVTCVLQPKGVLSRAAFLTIVFLCSFSYNSLSCQSRARAMGFMGPAMQVWTKSAAEKHGGEGWNLGATFPSHFSYISINLKKSDQLWLMLG